MTSKSASATGDQNTSAPEGPDDGIPVDRFRVALAIARIGVWEIDFVQQRCFYSDTFYRLLGREPDSIDSRIDGWHELIHPDDWPAIQKNLLSRLARSLPKGQEAPPIDWTYRMRHADGRWIWFQSRASALSDFESGRPTRLIISHSDISEQKRIKHETQQAETRATFALESAAQALWDLDFTTGKTYYSPEWLSMLGYREEDFNSDPNAWLDLIHPDDRDVVALADRRHKDGITPLFEAEFRMRHKDDHWVWVLDRGKVVSRDKDGAPLRMIGTHQDITERKQAEAELKEARDKAEAAVRAKTDFVANMSHELRTPLTSMIGITDLLSDELDDQLSKRHRNALKVQKEAAESLLGLVNDILDYSKLATYSIHIESIPLNPVDLAEACLAIVSQTAEQKKIRVIKEFSPGLPATVLGDPLRLRQILLNFLSNAVKFTPEGGRICLRLSSTDDGVIHFAVEDTGIGIPKEAFESLFDRFTQADTSTTRRFGGSGLGLAISKSLVELMGGRIGVESELYVGSTFHFSVPLQATRTKPENTSVQDSKAVLEGANILLAEDNAVNQKLIAMALENIGCIVTAVSDGEAAVRAAETSGDNGFDLILMDIQMPRLDGAKAAVMIRQMPDYEDVPIIALTANIYAGQEEEYQLAGFDSWQSKPVNWTELQETMAGLIEHGRSPNAQEKQLSAALQKSQEPERPDAATSPDNGEDQPHTPEFEDFPDGAEMLQPAVLNPAKIEEFYALFGVEDAVPLIEMFLQELKDRLALMTDPSTDLKTIGFEAHSLSSSAGTFGCDAVYRICREIMAAAKTDKDTTLQLLDQLSTAARDTQRRLNDYVAKPH